VLDFEHRVSQPLAAKGDGEIPGHRCVGGIKIVLGDRGFDHQPRGFENRADICEFVLHRLKATERLTKLLALANVGHRKLECAIERPECARGEQKSRGHLRMKHSSAVDGPGFARRCVETYCLERRPRQAGRRRSHNTCRIEPAPDRFVIFEHEQIGCDRGSLDMPDLATQVDRVRPRRDLEGDVARKGNGDGAVGSARPRSRDIGDIALQEWRGATGAPQLESGCCSGSEATKLAVVPELIEPCFDQCRPRHPNGIRIEVTPGPCLDRPVTREQPANRVFQILVAGEHEITPFQRGAAAPRRARHELPTRASP
jgi:hypothetical protein